MVPLKKIEKFQCAETKENLPILVADRVNKLSIALSRFSQLFSFPRGEFWFHSRSHADVVVAFCVTVSL
jgi:hypothetical protein